MTNRNCSSCGKKYPQTKDYFVSSKHCKLGLSYVCKACANLQKLAWKKKTGYKYKNKPGRKKDSIKSSFEDKNIYKSARNMRQGIILRGKNILCDKIHLTIKYFYEYLIKNSYCECCGLKFDFNSGRMINHSKAPTVDRINPNIGYILTNIAIICWRCNAVKGSGTIESLGNLLNWLQNEM